MHVEAMLNVPFQCQVADSTKEGRLVRSKEILVPARFLFLLDFRCEIGDHCARKCWSTLDVSSRRQGVQIAWEKGGIPVLLNGSATENRNHYLTGYRIGERNLLFPVWKYCTQTVSVGSIVVKHSHFCQTLIRSTIAKKLLLGNDRPLSEKVPSPVGVVCCHSLVVEDC